jgi:hypothetical protein
VNLGRRLLFAVLVYVTLDLSLPAMPGAFVFDLADSVESAQMNRGRAGADVLLLPAVSRDGLVASPPRVDVTRLETARRLGRPPRPVVSRLPRATLPAPPPSADPH